MLTVKLRVKSCILGMDLNIKTCRTIAETKPIYKIICITWLVH